jgi:DNA segregation ATPase FtsK/SpoIIIE, S-DNA-T family
MSNRFRSLIILSIAFWLMVIGILINFAGYLIASFILLALAIGVVGYLISQRVRGGGNSEHPEAKQGQRRLAPDTNVGIEHSLDNFVPVALSTDKTSASLDHASVADDRVNKDLSAARHAIVGSDAPQSLAPPKKPRSIGKEKREWTLPNADTILDANADPELNQSELRDRIKKIEETLAQFGAPARVVKLSVGPHLTRFSVQPSFLDYNNVDGQSHQVKVHVSAIASLSNDLALALAVPSLQIEAPIPGSAFVDIDVPHSRTTMVNLRSVVASEAYQKQDSLVKIALGQDVAGQPIVADLGTMPHLLIAGATGSGKSVCINAVVACLLMNNSPQTLNLVMVDPKMVELVTYNGIPHLIMPVITEVDKVVNALQWATNEMDRRYKLFAQTGVRNLEGFNIYLSERNELRLPYLVIMIDAFEVLLMDEQYDIVHIIERIVRFARPTGIHLVIATQDPSVNELARLIKTNFAARAALAMTTQADSHAMLDTSGAEKLWGRGDMLYMSSGSSKLIRLQGCFASDHELRQLVNYWRQQAVPESPELEHHPAIEQPLWEDVLAQQKAAGGGRDEMLDNAAAVVQEHGRASVSLLQRKLRIGYSRAARLIDLMEQEGIVGPPEEAGRERKVLIKGSTPSEHRD